MEAIASPAVILRRTLASSLSPGPRSLSLGRYRSAQTMLPPPFRPALLGVALPLLSTLTLLTPLALVAPLEVRAAEIAQSQERAANVARMRAEALNGGLSRYMTAACMHQLGGGSCMVKASSAGYEFKFLGGTPGWQTMKRKPTVETQIMVSADGTKVEKVIYNGAPR